MTEKSTNLYLKASGSYLNEQRMETILHEIALNTRPSNEWAFTLTSPPGGHTDSFEVFFSEPIVPEQGKKLELALLSLRTSYSWPNIRAAAGTANNEFRYSHDDGATWTTIALSEGAYEIEGINAAIQSAMRVNGHWNEMNSQYYVTLAPNLATLKVIVTIAHSDYKVDIANSSLRTVLGWPAGSPILTEGASIAPNIVQISDVNEVLIQCDAVAGSYTSSGAIKADTGFAIVSFYPEVPPGYKISYAPPHLVFFPVAAGAIFRVRLSLTDQASRPLPMRGELVTISCLIRERPI